MRLTAAESEPERPGQGDQEMSATGRLSPEQVAFAAVLGKLLADAWAKRNQPRNENQDE